MSTHGSSEGWQRNVWALSLSVFIAFVRVQGAQLLSVVVGPAVGGIVASHLGIRPAFYVTAAMCMAALIALIFLFQETGPLQRGDRRTPMRSVPLTEFLRYPHFIP